MTGNRTIGKLSSDEITRQAEDRAHLEPDPVRCVRGGWECPQCGERVALDLGALPWGWLVGHGKGCPGRGYGVDKTSLGEVTTKEASEGSGSVLGRKDSKQ